MALERNKKRVQEAAIVCVILFLSGCIGYQNVKVYERNEEGSVILTKQIKGYVIGTSGQKIQVKGNNISIEKKDAVSESVDLLKYGIEGGIRAAGAIK